MKDKGSDVTALLFNRRDVCHCVCWCKGEMSDEQCEKE